MRIDFWKNYKREKEDALKTAQELLRKDDCMSPRYTMQAVEEIHKLRDSINASEERIRNERGS